jgi:hypothetical protein
MTVRDLINGILDRSVWEYVFSITALLVFLALYRKTEEVKNEYLRWFLLFLVILLGMIVWYAGLKNFGYIDG